MIMLVVKRNLQYEHSTPVFYYKTTLSTFYNTRKQIQSFFVLKSGLKRWFQNVMVISFISLIFCNKTTKEIKNLGKIKRYYFFVRQLSN